MDNMKLLFFVFIFYSSHIFGAAAPEVKKKLAPSIQQCENELKCINCHDPKYNKNYHRKLLLDLAGRYIELGAKEEDKQKMFLAQAQKIVNDQELKEQAEKLFSQSNTHCITKDCYFARADELLKTAQSLDQQNSPPISAQPIQIKAPLVAEKNENVENDEEALKEIRAVLEKALAKK
jgi:hypothetical protein